MTPELRVALWRALATGFFSAVMVGLTTWSQTNDAKTIVIATATAFFSPFAARFVAEGSVDTARAAAKRHS